MNQNSPSQIKSKKEEYKKKIQTDLIEIEFSKLYQQDLNNKDIKEKIICIFFIINKVITHIYQQIKYYISNFSFYNKGIN